MAKHQAVETYYGDELEAYDANTGLAKIGGQSAYILTPERELTLRHELVAELAAAGVKPANIAKLMKDNPERTDSGHYARLLRDPRVKALAKQKQLGNVEEAQNILKSSVEKAATNIKNAVIAGDLKMSQYVLATQGVSEKKESNTNINLSFGAWLSSAQDTKAIHDIPQESPAIELNPNSTYEPTEGERL